jgi:hypothetical protein
MQWCVRCESPLDALSDGMQEIKCKIQMMEISSQKVGASFTTLVDVLK